MKYIFFVGPASGKETGQKNCFMASYSINHKKKLINIGGESLSFGMKLYCLIFAMIKFFTLNLILFNKECCVYITPSRSLSGFIRDCPFFIMTIFFRRKFICHWHGADIELFLGGVNFIARFFAVYFYSKASTHIVLTNGMKEQLNSIQCSRIVTIPNFFSFDVNFPDCSVNNSSSDHVSLIYMSNLIEQKGILDCLNAFEKLRMCYGENITLTVIGPILSSSNKLFVSQLLKLLSMPGVNYKGPLYGEEKFKELSMSDVFIFPSYYKTEAFPLVVLEAMATANAVVAYNHNYTKDFFNYSGGFLVEKRSVDAIVDAVKLIFSDKDQLIKMKKSNFEYSKKFTIEKYRNRIINEINIL